MASRMISTAIRLAASFAVSRQAVAAQRSFSGSTMAMKHKESTGKFTLVSPNIAATRPSLPPLSKLLTDSPPPN